MSQQPSFEAWAKGASVIRVGLCPEFDALKEKIGQEPLAQPKGAIIVHSIGFRDGFLCSWQPPSQGHHEEGALVTLAGPSGPPQHEFPFP